MGTITVSGPSKASSIVTGSSCTDINRILSFVLVAVKVYAWRWSVRRRCQEGAAALHDRTLGRNIGPVDHAVLAESTRLAFESPMPIFRE